ncbi:MAG: SGNH/GDSL hydrolase family protein [Polyangiaceae bacterium]
MSDASAQRGTASPKDPKAGLVSVDWFPKPPPHKPEGPAGTLVRMAIGAAAGAVLFKLGHLAVAYAAWGITAVVGGVSLVSPKARDAIARGLAWFGRTVGNAVGSVLLTLAYLLVLTPARFVKRLSGADDLRLKDEKIPSYYEPCDPEEHKRKYAGAMFATEVVRPSRGGAVVWLVTLLVLLGIAEGILRWQGFGPEAVLYVSDARAGYYPAPDQKHDRYGGRVLVNHFGMRAPDVAADKPAGTFRILMLGDSTLWGGSYVDQDQLYARILEKKLNEVSGGRKVEVLNMGVNGWGPFHERGYVEAFGTFGADLVLVCLPHDDVDRDKYTLMSLPYFSAGNPPRLALEEVMMHTMWRYRRDRIALDRTWREAQRELGIREYDRLATFLRDGDSAVKPEDRIGPPPLTKIGPAEVFFEILPSKAMGMSTPPIDPEAAAVEADVVAKLKKALDARGVATHYPAGLFANKGKAQDLYHDEVHLHWLGHQIYADFLVERVTKDSTSYRSFRAQGAGNAQ